MVVSPCAAISTRTRRYRGRRPTVASGTGRWLTWAPSPATRSSRSPPPIRRSPLDSSAGPARCTIAQSPKRAGRDGSTVVRAGDQLGQRLGVHVQLEGLPARDLDHRDADAVAQLEVVVAVDEDLLELERDGPGDGLHDLPSLVAQPAP